MPALPTPGDVHVNRPLTNIAIAHMQASTAFVAGRASPPVKVLKQSDNFFVWDAADMNRDEARLRGPGTEASLGAMRLSTQSYNCEVYAWGKLVSDQERANQDEPLDLDKAAAETAVQKLLIRRERRWAQKIFAASTWTGSTTGADIVVGTQWSTPATSDPVTDLRAQIFSLLKVPGVTRENIKLILGPEVYQVLLDHPDFLERYEQVQASILNEALIAAVLDIGEVLVPLAVHDTSVENVTPPAMSPVFIYGKNALLLANAANPGINVPSASYMFTWSGLVGSEGEGVRVKRFRREERESDQIEAQSAFDPNVVTPKMGVFFPSVVA